MFENVATTASTFTQDENVSKSGEDIDQEFRVMAVDEIWKDVEIGVEKWKNIKIEKVENKEDTNQNKSEPKTEENSLQNVCKIIDEIMLNNLLLQQKKRGHSDAPATQNINLECLTHYTERIQKLLLQKTQTGLLNLIDQMHIKKVDTSKGDSAIFPTPCKCIISYIIKTMLRNDLIEITHTKDQKNKISTALVTATKKLYKLKI